MLPIHTSDLVQSPVLATSLRLFAKMPLVSLHTYTRHSLVRYPLVSSSCYKLFSIFFSHFSLKVRRVVLHYCHKEQRLVLHSCHNTLRLVLHCCYTIIGASNLIIKFPININVHFSIYFNIIYKGFYHFSGKTLHTRITQ